MHAIIAFAIGPVGRYVVLAGLIAVLIGGVWIKVHGDGVQAERHRIERANAKARDAADRASDTVQTCAGSWNREAGRCEP